MCGPCVQSRINCYCYALSVFFKEVVVLTSLQVVQQAQQQTRCRGTRVKGNVTQVWYGEVCPAHPSTALKALKPMPRQLRANEVRTLSSDALPLHTLLMPAVTALAVAARSTRVQRLPSTKARSEAKRAPKSKRQQR